MYDMLIRGGHVIDPYHGVDAPMDVAIEDGRIAHVAPVIKGRAWQILDASGMLVTPGLIDLHVHVHWGVSHYGIEADQCCLARGVTTALEAGSAGGHTYPSLKRWIIDGSQTEIYALLNIAYLGMIGEQVGELEDPRFIDADLAVKVAKAPEVLGFKARLDRVGAQGVAEVLQNALAIATRANKPLMVHIGSAEHEIQQIVEAFGKAAARARQASFDVIEIHGAHGYLISEFLSPLTNHRQDDYGGSHENRARFAIQVTQAIRREWPETHPPFIRLSCSDWVAGGNQVEDAATYARLLKPYGIDVIDCSSGGVVNVRPQAYPGYQVSLAEYVRAQVHLPTVAVGLITQPEQAEGILRANQADIIALGRGLLRMPYWPHYAARTLGAESAWPAPYDAVRDMPIFPEH